jgi:FAD/FMN-containing dehydrogenase
VLAVQATVRARPTSVSLSVVKATRPHTPHVKSYKARGHPVDVSGLTRLLRVDAGARFAVAEGQVSMGQLCAGCLPLGVMPPLVPELPDFTVAGLTNGLGIQSASHRHGLFPDTLLAFEAVLADGSVLIAVRGGANDELFHELPGSYGSLGIVTAVVVRLVAAQPLVRSRYSLFREPADFDRALRAAVDQGHSGGSSTDFDRALRAAVDQGHSGGSSSESERGGGGGSDFVEGIVFGPHELVLIESSYVTQAETDAVGLQLFDTTIPGAEWYHQHVRRKASEAGCAGGGAPAEDTMRTLEYAFRMERGCWWMVECITGLPWFTATQASACVLVRGLVAAPWAPCFLSGFRNLRSV